MKRSGQGAAGRSTPDKEAKDGTTAARAPGTRTARPGRSGDRAAREPKPGRERAARAPGAGDPDVYLDIPVVKVDEIELEVENLSASVSLQAEVLDLLKLKVGVDVDLGRVDLSIKGVEAQALLKVQLDNVREIITRVLKTIDSNPQILEHVAKGARTSLEEVSRGTGELAGEAGRGAGRAAEAVAGGVTGAAEELDDELEEDEPEDGGGS